MRTLSRAALTVGACILLAAAAEAKAPPRRDHHGPGTGKFVAALEAEVRQLTADYNSGDVDKLAAHYAPDQTLLVPGEPNVVGAEAMRRHRQAQQAYEVTLKVAEPMTVDAAASGDVATVRATCVATIVDKATRKVFVQPNNCVLGYRRQPDGTMKVNWEITSPTARAAPPSGGAARAFSLF